MDNSTNHHGPPMNAALQVTAVPNTHICTIDEFCLHGCIIVIDRSSFLSYLFSVNPNLNFYCLTVLAVLLF